MSLNSFPNEILLQIFKDLYPPGAFEDWEPRKLENETIYPPHSYLPPGWKPVIDAEFAERSRARHYVRALYRADLAMRGIAAMSPRLRELSRDMLVLRFQDKVVMRGYTSELLPKDETWEKLVQRVGNRDEVEDILLRSVVQGYRNAKLMLRKEGLRLKEEKRRMRGGR